MMMMMRHGKGTHRLFCLLSVWLRQSEQSPKPDGQMSQLSSMCWRCPRRRRRSRCRSSCRSIVYHNSMRANYAKGIEESASASFIDACRLIDIWKKDFFVRKKIERRSADVYFLIIRFKNWAQKREIALCGGKGVASAAVQSRLTSELTNFWLAASFKVSSTVSIGQMKYCAKDEKEGKKETVKRWKRKSKGGRLMETIECLCSQWQYWEKKPKKEGN